MARERNLKCFWLVFVQQMCLKRFRQELYYGFGAVRSNDSSTNGESHRVGASVKNCSSDLLERSQGFRCFVIWALVTRQYELMLASSICCCLGGGGGRGPVVSRLTLTLCCFCKSP
jgi:hypothetical protein